MDPAGSTSLPLDKECARLTAGTSLRHVQAVRGIVDKAIQAAPEAAVAWVGVCLGLEVCGRLS